MVLTGQITANQAGTINYVSTYTGGCPGSPVETALATTTPAACSAGAPNDNGFNVLTGTALATAINVAAGQVMTVTISFS